MQLHNNNVTRDTRLHTSKSQWPGIYNNRDRNTFSI